MVLRCKGCNNVVAKDALKCPECGTALPKRSKGGKVLFWIVVVVFGLPAIGALLPEPPTSQVQSNDIPVTPPAKTTPAKKAADSQPKRMSPEQVLHRVLITKFSWRKDGFDTVMLATLTIHNTSSRPVKDIQITCTHSGNSGTAIDTSEKVLFEVVAPQARRTFTDFSMGFMHPQAAKSRCEITGLVAL